MALGKRNSLLGCDPAQLTANVGHVKRMLAVNLFDSEKPRHELRMHIPCRRARSTTRRIYFRG